MLGLRSKDVAYSQIYPWKTFKLLIKYMLLYILLCNTIYTYTVYILKSRHISQMYRNVIFNYINNTERQMNERIRKTVNIHHSSWMFRPYGKARRIDRALYIFILLFFSGACLWLNSRELNARMMRLYCTNIYLTF
jgi:hypothetical protein